MIKFLWIVFLILILANCGQKTKDIPKLSHKNTHNKSLSLIPTQFSNIKSWQYNNFEKSLSAFQKSCSQITRSKKHTILKDHPLFGYKKDWTSVCQKAKNTSLQSAKSFFENEFQPVYVKDTKNSLFTGYYIPELRGSFVKNNIYRYPLYEKPYSKKLPSRAAISKGALEGKAKPILWVDSEVDSFFLHIQGSGNVRLSDGRTVHVAYAGQNGHKYYAIGRHLIEKNYVPKEKMSAQAIKDWLNAHPNKAQSVMNLNPSYVFFKLKTNNTNQQAKGAAGVPLEPEYSLAVDDEYYPYGLPIWIETGVKVPVNDGSLQKMAFERLMVAQDTGGAINGAVRGDIFFGSGHIAEIMAGKQKDIGKKYVLLPRSAVARN